MAANDVMTRMYIYQPKAGKPLHELHGKNVLVCPYNGWRSYRRVYFLSGKVVSQNIPNICLVEGWVGQ